MNQKIKKECQDLLKIKGRIRGVILQTDINYVLQRKGEEGVKRIEQGFKELGFPIDFKEIKAVGWYPLGWAMVFGVLALKFFNWPESDMVEFGKQAPKFSFLIRALAKYLLSPKVLLKASSKLWTKQVNIGKAELVEFDGQKKQAAVQIKGIEGHWIICDYIRGYLETIVALTLKDGEVKVEETKCVLKGDPYHQFKITWQ